MPREKIVVIAKTYPEVSSKHGPLVCVAGVNEYGEWRRLYPIPYKIWVDKEYEDIRFKKWDIIEVEVKKASHDPRKESRKVVDWRKIKIIDHIKRWDYRLHIISRLLDPDIESVVNSDRSLGVVKPRRIVDFYAKPRKRLRDKAEKIVLNKMDEADSIITLLEYVEMKDKYLLPDIKEKDIKVEKTPWIGYRFYCSNPLCRGHEMMVIDWEAQELFRKYRQVDGPVKKKLYDDMITKRDLYFVIGNTWRYYKSFMIISLFYPPKGTKPIKPLVSFFKEKPSTRTLIEYT
ncbi:MAG: hypothetical protein DRJ52_10365, partial [Thermoprotei archaeon]